MNAKQLRAALRTPGPCFLFVPEIGTWITVVKVSLIDGLGESDADGGSLDARVEIDEGAIFIHDFGPREIAWIE